MEIQWIGTATILIKNGDDAILIDPYNQPYNKKFHDITDEEMENVKGIFITHPHLDHFTNIDKFGEQAGCPIYVNRRGINTAKKNGYNIQNMYEIIVGDEIQVGSLTVKVCQGLHCDLDHGLFWTFAHRLLNPIHLYHAVYMGIQQRFTFPIDTLDIFCFEVSNGTENVFVIGSANIYEPAYRPEHIDTLVFPFQGLRLENMFSHSIDMLGYYNADKVLFDHWDNAFPPVTTEMRMDKFMPIAKENFPNVEFIIPKRGQWFNVK